MSANVNSIIAYVGASLKETSESLGTTQFPSELEWYQIVGGLQVQGGKVSVGSATMLVVDFSAPYEKQVLGVFLQVVDGGENGAFISGVTQDNFELNNGVGARDYYWWAIGV